MKEYFKKNPEKFRQYYQQLQAYHTSKKLEQQRDEVIATRRVQQPNNIQTLGNRLDVANKIKKSPQKPENPKPGFATQASRPPEPSESGMVTTAFSFFFKLTENWLKFSEGIPSPQIVNIWARIEKLFAAGRNLNLFGK